MILYHGSNVAVERVDLSRCKPYKDFGRGFYLTTIEQQARDMGVRTTLRTGEGEPTVSRFELRDDWRGLGLCCRVFDEATRAWAVFVMNNRSRTFSDFASAECNHLNQYDIVVGPVADDRIAASFLLYQEDFISLDELVERLRFRKLSDQYAFHTERACSLLTYQGAL